GRSWRKTFGPEAGAMGAERLEQLSHLGRARQPVKGGVDRPGSVRIAAGERCGAGEDAERLEEIALGRERGDGEAGGAGDVAEGAEVDMGGEVGVARVFEGIGI